MWGDPSAEGADAFVLPGDAEIEQRMAEQPQAEPQPEVAAVEPDPETPGRERDENGRFVAATAEETPAETPAETEQRLLAGKYKSPEDLERAYQEAERRLGEQGNELGQYRAYLEQMQAAQQQQAQQAQAGQIDWATLLEENPT